MRVFIWICLPLYTKLISVLSQLLLEHIAIKTGGKNMQTASCNFSPEPQTSSATDGALFLCNTNVASFCKKTCG
ncbi:MAG TPA: hypothetical protein DCZ76_13950 [Treponema sp.]|nr:hypothetical protein [Treponema sp.]